MTVRRPLFPLLSLLLLPALAFGQSAHDLRPTAYAIKGAKVVVEPGNVIESANILIRDGLLADLGPDVAIPPDALVMEGKGMTVYPGFLDASSPRGYDPALRRSLGGTVSRGRHGRRPAGCHQSGQPKRTDTGIRRLIRSQAR